MLLLLVQSFLLRQSSLTRGAIDTTKFIEVSHPIFVVIGVTRDIRPACNLVR
jgi:hypothetical protein